MKKITLFIFTLVITISILNAQYQFKRIDTTMKLGKVGYKVTCNNKNELKNTVQITPVGFANSARDVNFEVKGRILKAEVDDLNRDMFPDLVIYLYNPGDKMIGNVIGVSSMSNENFMPITFPDIVNDPKLRVGYIGMDEYTLMEGSLMRRFPLYSIDSAGVSTPLGKYRQIQYQVVPGEKDGLKFKAVRSYEFAKQ
ncbi:MAG: hypothetical protein Q8K64_03030 [Sediminibacterium sp.]|nr:MAG: hypothetical protein FD183_186 [Chitinophagaceae bacterium]MDP1842370.1 hypothetical protein [Sediminibacterium sp.]